MARPVRGGMGQLLVSQYSLEVTHRNGAVSRIPISAVTVAQAKALAVQVLVDDDPADVNAATLRGGPTPLVLEGSSLRSGRMDWTRGASFRQQAMPSYRPTEPLTVRDAPVTVRDAPRRPYVTAATTMRSPVFSAATPPRGYATLRSRYA